MELHVKYIKESTGQNFKDYCKTRLNQDIRTFRQRLRAGKININDALLIIHDTGRKFEELFQSIAPKKCKTHQTRKTKQPGPTNQIKQTEDYFIEF